MVKYIFKNAAYQFFGVGFDPVNDAKTLSVKEIKVTHYSRRKEKNYGTKERLIFIIISNKIKAFDGKSEEEKDDYIKKHWKDFLLYAISQVYPNDLIVNYGEVIITNPQWDSLQEAKKNLDILDANITPVSPYS
ncbi:hypothetical protein DW1_2796 [Proteiniborus sp. DW1]|uniref:hypothetical protein n=1 Tax=Proteiniborus sp. DW1 TaxID=1889883 RepID=UPI00092E179B|nr:hypothetical protein [Proteiniborus sp. DW1]SCG84356.1 hypothetical protein DW1_2796 [Proteiniborus sp. DW1]